MQDFKQTMTTTKQPQLPAQPLVTSSDVTPKPSHVTGQEETQKSTPLKGELGRQSDGKAGFVVRVT